MPEIMTRAERLKELLELQGFIETAKLTMDRIIDQMKETASTVMGKDSLKDIDFAFSSMKEKIHDRIGDLVVAIVTILLDVYTDDEVDFLIKIYSSDVGKSILAKLPQATKLSQDIGEAWGQKIVDEVTKELDDLDKIEEAERKAEHAKKVELLNKAGLSALAGYLPKKT